MNAEKLPTMQQHALLSEIKKLTLEIRSDHPHLSRLLKEVPGPGVTPPQLHEQQLREHLAGLKVMLENYRKR